MKTAEAWFDENCDSDDASGNRFWHICEDSIAAIQLDAAQAALRLAANSIELGEKPDWAVDDIGDCHTYSERANLKASILAFAADPKLLEKLQSQ